MYNAEIVLHEMINNVKFTFSVGDTTYGLDLHMPSIYLALIDIFLACLSNYNLLKNWLHIAFLGQPQPKLSMCGCFLW